MKPTTKPANIAPKRPARLSPAALTLAPFASLPTRPAPAAKPAPAVTATKRPAATAKPTPVTTKPAAARPSAKPAPVSFAHLSGVRLAGPLLAPPKPAATARPAPKTDRAAADAGWDRAFRRVASPVPVTEAGTDDVAREWDRLLLAAAPRRPE